MLPQLPQLSSRPPAANPLYGKYYHNDGIDTVPVPRVATVTDVNPEYSNGDNKQENISGDQGDSGHIYASLMHPTPDHQ